MMVTLSGIVTLVRLSQPQKEPCPIVVTLFGIVTLVRLSHSWKAHFPMLVTPSSITKFLHVRVQLYHGCSVRSAKSAIAPEPLIVKVPPWSLSCSSSSGTYVQVTPSPQLPEVGAESPAAHTVPGSNPSARHSTKKVAKNRFFIPFLASLNHQIYFQQLGAGAGEGR